MGLFFHPEPQSDELQIREITKAFVDTQLRPSAVQDDIKGQFRRELFNELAALGLHCISVPEAFGGKGLSHRCHYAALEEIARGSVAMAITVGVTNLTQGGILSFGSDAQKKHDLNCLVKGDWLGAFSLSEPQSGSDAAALQCSAKLDGDHYILNGNKIWCSSVGHADLYLVMTRTGSHRTRGITSFLIEKDTPGFLLGKEEDKMGLKASSLGELIFENCRIPVTRRLGEEGEGFKVALSQLDAGRIAIGVAGIAIAIEAIENAWSYLLTRQTEENIPFEASARESLARLYAEAQSLKLLVTAVSEQKDEGKPVTLLASQLKLKGSDLAMHASSECISLVGPIAARREMQWERLFRDAKALQIVEGTNQVQTLVISREIDSMFKD